MEESESAESDEMPSPPKMSMKPLNINIPHHGERERYVIVIEKRIFRGRIRKFFLNSDCATPYLSHTIREVS